jgi:multidrug efflux pump subunit AcrA (membrane-fusion protein)
METIRRFVFPIIWMVIFAVIAIALGKMAFFSDDSNAADPDDDGIGPVVDYDQYATVPAEKGDIASTLELSATVVPDPSTPLLATHAGEVNWVWVKNGDTVDKGDEILQVRVPVEEQETATETGTAGGTDDDTDGTVAAPTTPPEQKYHYYTLRATSAGTVKEFNTLVGQELGIGDTVLQLSPGTYSISAELTPEQQLDLLDKDIEATAALPTSEDPIRCTKPSIEEDEAGDGSGDNDDPEQQPQIDPQTGEEITPETSAASLTCAVPKKTAIVPGLSVTITVDLGSAEGVLTVPTTAVEGSLAQGTVYQLDEETGEPVPVGVELGLRGPDTVEIKSGLEEGDEVLQFVPGVENPDGGMGGEEMFW